MIYPTRYQKCPVKNDSAQPDRTAEVSKKVDLIDRQAAIDDLRDKDPSQIWDTADVEVWVNSLPSAQPEIIYCKDCKRWKERSPICNRTGKIGYGAYDFCSKGERRTDETD